MSGFLYQVAQNSSGGVQSVSGNLVDDTDPLNPVVSLPYTVYTAIWYQVSTNAPTVNVLQNSLPGAIVWARTGVGTYTGTLAGVFLENLTFITAKINYESEGGNAFFVNAYRASNNEIAINIQRLDETFAWSNFDDLSADNIKFVFLEIRVY